MKILFYLSVLLFFSCGYEAGLPAVLPANTLIDENNIPEENTLKITITNDNEINVEQLESQSFTEIQNHIRHFLKKDLKKDTSQPNIMFLTEELCDEKINILKNHTSDVSKEELTNWKKKLLAVKTIGNFYVTNDSSFIEINYSKSNSYGDYLVVRDIIMTTINDLRNELSIVKFGSTYEELEDFQENKKNEVNAEKINALRLAFPQNIRKRKIDKI
ncbi:MAG: hypothetical protein ACPGVD_00010 [Flavobacteriales bacterium]